MSSFNEQKNLSDVFKELQQTKKHYDNINNEKIKNKKEHKSYKNIKFLHSTPIVKTTPISNPHNLKTDVNMNKRVAILSVLLGTLTIVFIIATLSYSYTKETVSVPAVERNYFAEFESNNNSLSMEQIISGNIDSLKSKEIVTEDKDIEFESTYKENPLLPKGEEVVVTEGVLGKESVTAVKIYENGELVDETVLERATLEKPINKVIEIGTSEYLAKYNVHINDTMYLTESATLRKTTDSNAEDICEIKQYFDVVLIGLEGDFCKVKFDDKEGYLPSSILTSETFSPEIVEKNRAQRILNKLDIEMPLNVPSGLTLSDYKKVLSNNPSDVNKIFEDNYQSFYEVEKAYKINGIFLAALAIHESGWGTSQIAQDKKNLFGYGAHDSDPYNGAYEFEDYKDGLELVAKIFAKYYINPRNTKIYNNETATGSYYYGSTLEDVNKKYSTDSDWHKKVYKYMQTLYNKL